MFVSHQNFTIQQFIHQGNPIALQTC